MDKYGALLHARWKLHDKEQGIILGYRAEDYSQYSMRVPHQLAPLLVDLQNRLSDIYREIVKRENELSELRSIVGKVFPWSDNV